MVLHIVGSFIGLIKVKLHTKVDGSVFGLHYRWSAAFCFLACALVSATEYIGSAIICVERGDKPAPKAVNTFCWISGTHTINSTKSESHYNSRGETFHGTGEYDPSTHVKTYHTYYQWIPFVLFFQGCLFYLPHLLWKVIEGKTADKLLQGLHYDCMDADRDKKNENIVNYMKVSSGKNMRYALGYLFCEGLNLLNVILQMVLLDAFFSGTFMNYGTALSSATKDAPALTSMFPRVTKCTFYHFGTGGDLTTMDLQCILPQNILNEKVFITMWFWLVILATITAIELVWKICVAVSPVVRLQIFEKRGKLSADSKLEMTIKRMHLGDYFLLSLLGTNLDASNFKDILLKLSNGEDLSIHPNGNASYRNYDNLHPEADDDEVHEAPV